MHVVSQDRRFIEELRDCSIHQETNRDGCNVQINGRLMGQYQTQDRGSAVMKKIVEALIEGNRAFVMPEDEDLE